jgi:hypothetical protein
LLTTGPPEARHKISIIQLKNQAFKKEESERIGELVIEGIDM